MTGGRQLHVSPGLAAAAVLAVLIIGAGGTFMLMRTRVPADAPGDSRPATTTSQPPAVPESAPAPDTLATTRADVVVTLSKDAADRAGIEVAPVTAADAPAGLRLPGIVEPNAYRQVTVTPLVGGRVLRAMAQLGDRVRKGQAIAQLYSPELADARAKYVAARAMLEAHDRELQRTRKLVEIGAASRQELEQLHAEHAAQTAEVDSARSRLELLAADVDAGSPSAPQESAITNVRAPIDGVVTERQANPGLNVDPSSRLFTIVDLSDVWVIADVYERDLARVREGARATVTTAAFPEKPLEGRVSFIDPQLNAPTRTARIRLEVANPRGELRIGMYTDVIIESAAAGSVLMVPKGAIQIVGASHVVYVASPGDRTRFVEREVQLGRAAGNHVEVQAGLSAGDSVVSKGSFFVRAEVERLGLRGAQPSSSAGTPGADSADVQAATIAVTESGFEPDRVSVRAGVPARLTFIRTTDKTCATEVVFPSLDLKRAMPLNQPVVVAIKPSKIGDVAFLCGMKMLKGAVVVQ